MLTKIEKRAMELYHLGGIEAWRSNGNNVKPNTVNSLIRKGFFNSHDLTKTGEQYIKKYIAQ